MIQFMQAMSDFNSKLKKCETLKQVFDLVNQEYKTDKNMGIIYGNMIRQKIPDIIELLKLEKK